MIKINLDSTPKGKFKYVLKGSVQVSGEVSALAFEIYEVMKDFEKSAPDSLFLAIDRLIFDGLEEE